jgi:DNA-binding protein HU-beta
MGFGTFKSAKRVALLGKSQRTDESVKIAAAIVPKFSVGTAFKAAVKNTR